MPKCMHAQCMHAQCMLPVRVTQRPAQLGCGRGHSAMHGVLARTARRNRPKRVFGRIARSSAGSAAVLSLASTIATKSSTGPSASKDGAVVTWPAAVAPAAGTAARSDNSFATFRLLLLRTARLEAFHEPKRALTHSVVACDISLNIST